jgi:hypothetical protein
VSYCSHVDILNDLHIDNVRDHTFCAFIFLLTEKANILDIIMWSVYIFNTNSLHFWVFVVFNMMDIIYSGELLTA